MAYVNSSGLATYFDEISKYPLLTRVEELELGKRSRLQNDSEARTKLVNSNLRFVVSVAKRYQNRGVELHDLINEGNLGLIEASNRYDERKDNKFISYAVWWIRQGILKAIADKGKNVRIPINRINLYETMREYCVRYETANGSKPNDQELIEKFFPNSIDKTELLSSFYNYCEGELSLNKPLSEDSDITLQDTLEAESDMSIDLSGLENLLRRESEIRLKPREKKVIELYYLTNPSLSLEEIGQVIGLTRERVRQIRNKGLLKLKKSEELRKLYEEQDYL